MFEGQRGAGTFEVRCATSGCLSGIYLCVISDEVATEIEDAIRRAAQATLDAFAGAIVHQPN